MKATPCTPEIAPWRRPCSDGPTCWVMSDCADWTRQAPQRQQRNPGEENGAGRREPVEGEAACSERDPKQQGAPLAQALDDHPDQPCPDHRAHHTDRGQDEADRAGVPAVSIVGVQHEEAGLDLVRDGGEEDDAGVVVVLVTSTHVRAPGPLGE